MNNCCKTNTYVLSEGKGWLKPKVLRTQCSEGNPIVLKDFSQTPFLLKPVAQFLCKREANILNHLQFNESVPRFYGFCDNYCYAMEYIEGYHPQTPSNIQRDEAYEKARQFLNDLHSRDIAHNDFRAMNIILTKTGEIKILDFGATLKIPCFKSRFFGWFYSPMCKLLKIMQQADVYHLAKLKPSITTSKHDLQDIHIMSKGRPLQGLSHIWKQWIRNRIKASR